VRHVRTAAAAPTAAAAVPSKFVSAWRAFHSHSQLLATSRLLLTPLTRLPPEAPARPGLLQLHPTPMTRLPQQRRHLAAGPCSCSPPARSSRQLLGKDACPFTFTCRGAS
jgi:hypothetical protein